MTVVKNEIHSHVDRLYQVNFSGTYEGVVHKNFLDAMRKSYGIDEDKDSRTSQAFVYAREVYGYQNPVEQKQSLLDDENNGYCSHGVEFDCCPAGCGEY